MTGPPRRALLLAVSVLVAACASNHHVSPFLDIDASVLLTPIDDLPAQLSRVDAEARALGMQVERRVEGRLPTGDALVAVGLVGRDLSGAEIHATRVVTPSSIVLALGPSELGDARRGSSPVELVESVLPGGGFPSGRDLTGDGTPDVVVRAPDGSIAVYSVSRLGATRMQVACAFPPTSATDVNADGRMDLVCRAPVDRLDVIAPELLDVAVGEKVAFDHDDPDAVAFHVARIKLRAAAEGAPPRDRLRALLETSFARVRAGEQAEVVIAELDRTAEPWLTPALRGAWVTHRRTLIERARPPAVRTPSR